jgi:hypothetical protein
MTGQLLQKKNERRYDGEECGCTVIPPDIENRTCKGESPEEDVLLDPTPEEFA